MVIRNKICKKLNSKRAMLGDTIEIVIEDDEEKVLKEL